MMTKMKYTVQEHTMPEYSARMKVKCGDTQYMNILQCVNDFSARMYDYKNKNECRYPNRGSVKICKMNQQP